MCFGNADMCFGNDHMRSDNADMRTGNADMCNGNADMCAGSTGRPQRRRPVRGTPTDRLAQCQDRRREIEFGSNRDTHVPENNIFV
jgi:hypothetical protein